MTDFEKLLTKRKVSVLVHKGVFEDDHPEGRDLDEKYYFVKIINTSPWRDLEVSHIWVDTDPIFHVLNDDRPLPARIRPDETFETYIPELDLPKHHENIETLVKVQLSVGKIFSSHQNIKVPGQGQI